MHQAQIAAWGEAPKYVEVPDLPAPGPDELRIKVLATGVHQVVRSRASGRHYMSGKPPHVPGIDGTGIVEAGNDDDFLGKTVYWSTFDVGSMSEFVNVSKRNVRVLPKGTDPVQAAGIMNPALSSWMAFQSRTSDVPTDFTVLVLGATSASGRVAVSLSRSLGAKRVIGAARNTSALSTLGLDGSVTIAQDPTETDFGTLGDVDVIVDYIYGPLAAHCLTSLRSIRPTQYIHVGALSEQDLLLPGAVIRSKNLTIRGSGPGAWSMDEQAKSIGALLELVKDIPEQPVKRAKLQDIEKAWNEPTDSRRLVFEP